MGNLISMKPSLKLSNKYPALLFKFALTFPGWSSWKTETQSCPPGAQRVGEPSGAPGLGVAGEDGASWRWGRSDNKSQKGG